MKPGTYRDLPFKDYLAIDAASKGKLWALHTKTPAHCQVDRDPTPDMVWGTVFHTALLEPGRFLDGIVANPYDGRTKDGKKFKDEHAGYTVISKDDYDGVMAARDALLRNPTIKALIEREGMSEATGVWIDPDTGLLCRCRPDHYVPSLAMAVDIKTTTNAGAKAFAKTAANFGYDLQAEFYSEGWNRAGGGEVENFIFVVVERDPPYAHALYEIDEPGRAMGQVIMRKALARYAECKASGVWPGHPAEVVRLSFPQWVYQEA